MKKRTVFFLIAILIVFGCIEKPKTGGEDKILIGENITNVVLTTQDNIKIAGTYYRADSEKGVILLHMMNKDKSTYDAFAKKLVEKGYNAIAIDLRGHGESDLDWKTFSEEDFKNMILDVKAAKEFLAEKDITKFAIVGASIGANIALNFAVEDNGINAVVLLSPGLDFRGFKTSETIKQFTKPILIVAGKQDTYSYNSSVELKSSSPSSIKELKIYDSKNHGTDLFKDTDIMDYSLNWLDKNF
jgi:alpha-beta hydrolase superfamily lysophospholipase